MIRIALFLLIGMTLTAAGCSKQEEEAASLRSEARPEIEVTLASVQRSSLTASVELVGNLLPRRRTVIVAEVDGVISEIPQPKKNPVTVDFKGRQITLPLDIGSEVAEGDLLVKLDASDYENQLKVAEAHLAQTKAALVELMAWKRPEEITRVRALYQEAEANLQRAEPEFERMKSLFQSQATSRSEFEEKQLDMLRARALLAQAKADLDIAEAGPTAEQIAVAKAQLAAAEAEVERKRWNVAKTSIFAPYDAVVTDRYVDVGDRVTAMPRVEIMELMDISFLVAEVGVPEQYSGQIRHLDLATVSLQGSADPIPGLVVRVNDKVDSDSRTFRIRVAIENEQRAFRVGQFARVTIDVATSNETPIIPRRAVLYAGGQPQVFVYSEGRVTRQEISLGLGNEQFFEVISGVREGQQIVVDDPAILTDGMQVQPTKS